MIYPFSYLQRAPWINNKSPYLIIQYLWACERKWAYILLPFYGKLKQRWLEWRRSSSEKLRIRGIALQKFTIFAHLLFVKTTQFN